MVKIGSFPNPNSLRWKQMQKTIELDNPQNFWRGQKNKQEPILGSKSSLSLSLAGHGLMDPFPLLKCLHLTNSSLNHPHPVGNGPCPVTSPMFRVSEAVLLRRFAQAVAQASVAPREYQGTLDTTIVIGWHFLSWNTKAPLKKNPYDNRRGLGILTQVNELKWMDLMEIGWTKSQKIIKNPCRICPVSNCLFEISRFQNCVIPNPTKTWMIFLFDAKRWEGLCQASCIGWPYIPKVFTFQNDTHPNGLDTPNPHSSCFIAREIPNFLGCGCLFSGVILQCSKPLGGQTSPSPLFMFHFFVARASS